MTPADVLRRAASLVRERGWVKGQLRGPGGRLCAYGAIAEAATEGRTSMTAYAAIRYLATRISGEPHAFYDIGKAIRCVAAWNDNAATGAEVAARLDHEAARWEVAESHLAARVPVEV